MDQEVLDGEPPGLAHGALGDGEQRVNLVGGAYGAAALLVAEGRGRLLGAVALATVHLQLLTEVLVDALGAAHAPTPAPAAAAPARVPSRTPAAAAAAGAGAVAAGEGTAARYGVQGEGGRHGLVAARLVVVLLLLCVGRHRVDAAVVVLASLPSNILE